MHNSKALAAPHRAIILVSLLFFLNVNRLGFLIFHVNLLQKQRDKKMSQDLCDTACWKKKIRLKYS